MKSEKFNKIILDLKRDDASLSCREISEIIKNKYSYKLSKSTINEILKNSDLSSRVGRASSGFPAASTKPLSYCGLYFLKAADLACSFSVSLAEAIKSNNSRLPEKQINSKLETQLYLPYFSSGFPKSTEDSALWRLSGCQYGKNAIYSYIQSIKDVTAIKNEIIKRFVLATTKPAYIKIILADGQNVFIDPLFRNILANPSEGINKYISVLKSACYIKRIFKSFADPLVIRNASFDESRHAGFAAFCSSLGSPLVSNPPLAVQICGADDSVLESIRLAGSPRRIDFILGVQPGQFEQGLRITGIKEFIPFEHELIWEKMYMAEARAEFTQSQLNEHVTLRSIVLKNYISGENRSVIISNIPAKEWSAREIVRTYLLRSPSQEHSFSGYSYGVSKCRETDFEINKNFNKLLENNELDINSVLNHTRLLLEGYCADNIFPAEWDSLGFEQVKNAIFPLKANIKQTKESFLVDFEVPNDFPLLNGLVSACSRVNDLALEIGKNSRLFFRTRLISA